MLEETPGSKINIIEYTPAQLVAWLAESTERSWTLVKAQAHNAAGATLGASKSAGNLVARGASAAAGATANLGKRAGAGVAAGANRVSAAHERHGVTMHGSVHRNRRLCLLSLSADAACCRGPLLSSRGCRSPRASGQRVERLQASDS